MCRSEFHSKRRFSLTKARLTTLVIVASVGLLGATACAGNIATMNPMGVNVQAGVPFERLVDAVRASGYQVSVVQPERYRFGVFAHAQRRESSNMSYRIAVTCSGSRCAITPYGPRVEWNGRRYRLPRAFRQELVEFHQLLQANAYAR